MRTDRHARWMGCLLLGFVLVGGADRGESEQRVVVIYSSVDEFFARPIVEDFQRETGIEARLVPDTEETKSTGLLNRLIFRL